MDDILKNQNKLLSKELDNQRKVVKKLRNFINDMHDGWSTDKDKLGKITNQLSKLEKSNNTNNESEEFDYVAEKRTTEKQGSETKASGIGPRKDEILKSLLEKKIEYKNPIGKMKNVKVCSTPTVVAGQSLLKSKVCEEIISNCDINRDEIQKENHELQKEKKNQDIQKGKDCRPNKPMIVTRHTMSKIFKPEEMKSIVNLNKLETRSERGILTKNIICHNTSRIATRHTMSKNFKPEEIKSNVNLNKLETQSERGIFTKNIICHNTSRIASRHTMSKTFKPEEIKSNVNLNKLETQSDRGIFTKNIICHNTSRIATRHTMSKTFKPEEIKSNVNLNKLETQSDRGIFTKNIICHNTPRIVTRRSLLKNKVCEGIKSNCDEDRNEKVSHEIQKEKECCNNKPIVKDNNAKNKKPEDIESRPNAYTTKLMIKKEMERFCKLLENSLLQNEGFEEIQSNFDALQEVAPKKIRLDESCLAEKSPNKKIWDERESSHDFSTMDDHDWDMTADDSLRETEPGTIPCPLCCNELFSTQESLKYHLLSILENVFCPVCSRRYENIMSLITHLGKECDGKPKYDSDVDDECVKQDPVAKVSTDIFKELQNTLAVISFKRPDEKILSNGICITVNDEDSPSELSTEMNVDMEDYTMSEDEIMSEEPSGETYRITEEICLNKVFEIPSKLNKKKINSKPKIDPDEIYQITEENNLNPMLYIDMSSWTPSAATNVDTRNCNLKENKVMLKFKKHLDEICKIAVEVALSSNISSFNSSFSTLTELNIETNDCKLKRNQISGKSKKYNHEMCKKIMSECRNHLNETCKMAVDDVLKSAAYAGKISSLPTGELPPSMSLIIQDCYLNKKQILSELKKRLNKICRTAILGAFISVEHCTAKNINIQDHISNKNNHLMFRFAKMLNNIYQMAIEKAAQSEVDAETSPSSVGLFTNEMAVEKAAQSEVDAETSPSSVGLFTNVNNLDQNKIITKSGKPKTLEEICQIAVDDGIKSPSIVLDNHNIFINDEDHCSIKGVSLSEDVEMDLDDFKVHGTNPTETVDNDYVCSACDMTFSSISEHIVQYHMGQEVQVQGPAEELKEKLAQWNVVEEKEEVAVSNLDEQQPDQTSDEKNQQLNETTNQKSDPKLNQISIKEKINPSTIISGYWIQNKVSFKYVNNVEKMKLLDPSFVAPLYKVKTSPNSGASVPKGLFSIMRKQYLWLDNVNLIQMAEDKDLTPFMDRSLDKLRVYVVDQRVPVISNFNLGPVAKIVEELPEVSKYLKSGGDKSGELYHILSETESNRNSYKFYSNQFIQVVEVEIGNDKEITIENVNFKRIPTIPEHIVPFIDNIDVPWIPLLRQARMLKWRCMLCLTPTFTINSALQHACYRCEFCNVRLVRSFCAVRNHMLEIHPKKCPANLRIEALAKTNENSTLESENASQTQRLTTCFFCTCGYSYQETYEYHLNLKLKSLIPCSICKVTVNKTEFDIHMKWHEENKFCCEICNRDFTNEIKYQIHIEMHRQKNAANKNAVVCNICNESFKNSLTLKQHSLQHDGSYRPHVCEFCTKRFKNKKEKTVHERNHTKEKPFICKECGKCFRRSYSRALHMKRHAQKRDFKCEICNKEFNLKSALRTHRRIHDEERPFKCTDCGIAFKSQAALCGHTQRHTSPFKCPYCPLRFSSITCSQRHAILHETGGKGFHCMECPAVFRRNHLLIQHMEEKHGVEPTPRPVRPVTKRRIKSEDEDTTEQEDTSEDEGIDAES